MPFADHESKPPATTPARILVVEDEPDLRKLLARLLAARGGYRVQTAGTGQEALEQARLFPPDLVLMDIMLPDLDGLEVARRLQESRPRDRGPLPILALTALHDDRTLDRAAEVGCFDFLTKPVHPALLLEKVASYLAAGAEGERPPPAPRPPAAGRKPG